ncbi:MAG: aminotransferase class V-fold PLP-dependent enzyme [Clostridia bacterium]|nr:aminotransferase class V-fold PLP-dependent enzyme [Clostridia bacterium]
MVYLDNAATTFPKPECVIQSVIKGMRISANPGRSGHNMSREASDEVFTVRQKLAEFFNSSADRVIFTANCTQSLNTAIKGIVRRGDHVITSSLEHNSVMRVLHKLRKDGVITYDTAKVYHGDDERTVAAFREKIRKNTALIVCIHASNVFGTVLPIERIGELAHGHGLKFIVDGAQSAGVLPIDMQKMKIDALCIPGHKGLYGAMGTGVLIFSDRCEIEPLIYGGTGSESMNPEQPEIYPDRLESGTLNLPGIMSIGSGIDFIKCSGISRIHAYEAQLCRELHNYLSDIKGVKLYTSSDSRYSVPVLAFNYKNLHSEEVAQHLNKGGICVRAGYHCAYQAHKSHCTEEQGIVRVSFGAFNTKNDVKIFINCLNRIEK